MYLCDLVNHVFVFSNIFLKGAHSTLIPSFDNLEILSQANPGGQEPTIFAFRTLQLVGRPIFCSAVPDSDSSPISPEIAWIISLAIPWRLARRLSSAWNEDDGCCGTR